MTELFSDLELKARQIILDARVEGWSPCQQRVLNFFKAYWSGAYPAEQIAAVSDALYGPAGLSLQPFLTALVKRKVLRSRRLKGVTHYEVNL